jgi:hypothetical protein
MLASSVLSRAALPLAAIVLAGCATVGPNFAQLDGERWRKVELNTFDVTLISVDGKHHLQRRGEPVIVEPGLRKVVVQGPPVAGFRYGEQRTLELKIEPCMRYWLEAKKDTALAQDFVPRVNYSEKIAGCGAEPRK